MCIKYVVAFFFAVKALQNLQFIELGADTSRTNVFLPLQNDGVSGVINVSTGFAFGNTTQTAIKCKSY